MNKQLLNTYLTQQADELKSSNHSENNYTNNENSFNESSLVLYNDPEKMSLNEFKILVKKWLELDIFIKKAKEVIKEKKTAQDKLSPLISKFMCKYELEDINTKDGRIRCKTTKVNAPISQKIIKDKIADYFKGNENQKNDILHKIYDEREKIEKVSLRRLKIT